MKIGDNVILEKSVEFSLSIISYCEELESKRKYVIANQLLKSGTSIGANIHEAQNAESKADFIHKMKLAAKELEETKYWLLLCTKSQNYPDSSELGNLANEIGRILFKIIASSKKKSTHF